MSALWSLGIGSFEELAAALPTLAGDDLVTAIWALPYFDLRRATPLALRLCNSEDAELRKYALVVLGLMGTACGLPAFVRLLRDDPDPHVREIAAHGLGFHFKPGIEAVAFEPLITAFEDSEQPIAVRAQCAESLGNVLGYGNPRERGFRRAERALIDALEHPDPAMRFWCAFALGTMRSRKSLPALERLAATDEEICPRWWPVKDEAADAIVCIRTGGWPDHDRPRHRPAEVAE